MSICATPSVRPRPQRWILGISFCGSSLASLGEDLISVRLVVAPGSFPLLAGANLWRGLAPEAHVVVPAQTVALGFVLAPALLLAQAGLTVELFVLAVAPALQFLGALFTTALLLEAGARFRTEEPAADGAASQIQAQSPRQASSGQRKKVHRRVEPDTASAHDESAGTSIRGLPRAGVDASRRPPPPSGGGGVLSLTNLVARKLAGRHQVSYGSWSESSFSTLIPSIPINPKTTFTEPQASALVGPLRNPHPPW